MNMPLITMPDARFHEACFKLHLLYPLSQHALSLARVLAGCLTHASRVIPDLRSRILREGEIYGGNVFIVVKPYYKVLDFQVVATTPADRLTCKGNFERTLSMLQATLFDPLFEGGVFREEIVKEEVEIARSAIKRRADDKQAYALYQGHRLFEETVDELGSEEDYKSMTASALTTFYHDLIKNSAGYAEALGDYPKEVCAAFLARLPLALKPFPHPNAFYKLDIPSPRAEKKRVEEERITQSWLVESYRLPYVITSPLREASTLFLSMLGGSYASLLFQRVREEKGLCYTIYAAPYGVGPAFFVLSGLARNTLDEATVEIERTLEDFKAGRIEKSLLDSVKSQTKSDLLGLADHLSTLSTLRVRALLSGEEVAGEEVAGDEVTGDEGTGDEVTLERLMARYEAVELSDIVRVARAVKREAVYLLAERGDENE